MKLVNLFKGLGLGSYITKHSWRFQKRKEMVVKLTTWKNMKGRKIRNIQRELEDLKKKKNASS